MYLSWSNVRFKDLFITILNTYENVLKSLFKKLLSRIFVLLNLTYQNNERIFQIFNWKEGVNGTFSIFFNVLLITTFSN